METSHFHVSRPTVEMVIYATCARKVAHKLITILMIMTIYQLFHYNSHYKTLKVNLGTRFGQRMHSLHMLILPLIPIFILLVQNGIKFGTNVLEADEILNVQRQVQHNMG